MPLLLLIIWIVGEAWTISRLAERFGTNAVLIWLVLAAVAGVLLIQRQGLRTVRELQLATARGELPGPILLESLVVLIAGLLLILPGLLSDVIALSLVFGLRKRLAARLGDGIAKARPDLKQPVTLEGEYQRKR